MGCCLVVGGGVSFIDKLLTKCCWPSQSEARYRKWQRGMRVCAFVPPGLGQDSSSDILQAEIGSRLTPRPYDVSTSVLQLFVSSVSETAKVESAHSVTSCVPLGNLYEKYSVLVSPGLRMGT